MPPVAKHKGAPKHSCSHPNQPPYHLPSGPHNCTIPPHLMSERLCHIHCTPLPPSPASPDPPTPAPYPSRFPKRGTAVSATL
eukprot:scaffold3455_cov62-Phaeocystis_antarctica.AAC.5